MSSMNVTLVCLLLAVAVVIALTVETKATAVAFLPTYEPVQESQNNVSPGEPVSRAAPYPNSGVILGQGWTTNTETKAPALCVDFATADDSGQDVFLDLTNVVDNSQMLHEMNVSASASYNAIAGSASAKISFSHRVQITDDHDYFVAHAQVLNGAHYLVPPGLVLAQPTKVMNGTILKAGLWDTRNVVANGRQIDLTKHYSELAASNPSQFFKTCGDSFVSVIHDGAEVIARLQIEAHSIDERRTLSTSLEGSYAGASLSVQANDTLQNLQTSKKLNILYFESGGSGEPIATDKDALLNNIKNLAVAAKTAPHPFVITVQRYDTLPSWPQKAADISHSLQSMGNQYARLKTLYDQAEFIKNNPSSFVLRRGVSLEQVKSTQDELRDRLESINNQIGKCIQQNTRSACTLDQADAAPDYSFRILFPTRPDVVEGNAALRAAVHNLYNLKATLESERFPLGTDSQGKPVLRQLDYDKLGMLQKEIDEASRQVALLDAQALRKAIADQWIIFPSASRCKNNIHDAGCLSNAQIDMWTAKINIR